MTLLIRQLRSGPSFNSTAATNRQHTRPSEVCTQRSHFTVQGNLGNCTVERGPRYSRVCSVYAGEDHPHAERRTLIASFAAAAAIADFGANVKLRIQYSQPTTCVYLRLAGAETSLNKFRSNCSNCPKLCRPRHFASARRRRWLAFIQLISYQRSRTRLASRLPTVFGLSLRLLV